MIKGLFKSVRNGKADKIILFISDIVLTICMPIVIVTGIFMARELFVIESDTTTITEAEPEPKPTLDEYLASLTCSVLFHNIIEPFHSRLIFFIRYRHI